MKIAIFSAHPFERDFLINANAELGHELSFFETKLSLQTVALAQNHSCACCFVGDQLDATTLPILADLGVKLIALRSAGYNHVDLLVAAKLGLRVVRVPAYSPHAIAEHAVALLLALDRHIPKAYNRVRELNFSLEGLMGFDLFEKTVGIIGTGKIGTVMAKIMHGFGCRILAHDPAPNSSLVNTLGVTYVSLSELYQKSDIISLHVPLVPQTKHMIDGAAFAQMKKGAFLINTSRGALIDTAALINALKSGHLGAAGLDVYEEEEGIFYKNLSDMGIQDDVLARLLTFPNVMVTSHQAFLTHEAVNAIATTTMQNVSDFQNAKTLVNEVHADTHVATSNR